MTIKTALIEAANGCYGSSSLHSEELAKVVSVPIESLSKELKELPTYLRIYNREQNIKIKKVTKIETLCDIISSRPSFKSTLPAIHRALIYYKTIPLSSATAERSFSVMRRLKTWVRNRMSGEHLNTRMLASIHQDRLDNVNLKKIAINFVNKEEKRTLYFGKF